MHAHHSGIKTGIHSRDNQNQASWKGVSEKRNPKEAALIKAEGLLLRAKERHHKARSLFAVQRKACPLTTPYTGLVHGPTGFLRAVLYNGSAQSGDGWR